MEPKPNRGLGHAVDQQLLSGDGIAFRGHLIVTTLDSFHVLLVACFGTRTWMGYRRDVVPTDGHISTMANVAECGDFDAQ